MARVKQPWETEVEKWEKQEKEMLEKDAKAKKESKLVGRYITPPAGDSCAYYEVIRENKKTVRIKHLNIWDGWIIGYWGKEATINKQFVINDIAWRDKLAAL